MLAVTPHLNLVVLAEEPAVGQLTLTNLNTRELYGQASAFGLLGAAPKEIVTFPTADSPASWSVFWATSKRQDARTKQDKLELGKPSSWPGTGRDA